MYVFLWFVLIIILGVIAYKLYKIANSDELSATIRRDRFLCTLLILFAACIFWLFVFLSYRENSNKPKDQYPKIVVYDNAKEYQNQLGTEIDVNYEGSQLTHIKRTEVKRTPDSDEVMVVITLGFEEEQ